MMIINTVIRKIQDIAAPYAEVSFFVKYIDKLIFLSICGAFLASLFCTSDTIGYFAVIGIILTFIKILLSKGFKFEYTRFELMLLIYLGFVIISTAGASLFYLSFKGLLKTLVYLGYYITCTVYLNNNKQDVYKFFLLLAFCAGYESIIGLIQNYTRISALAGWQDISGLNPEEVMTRVYGTLKPLNPNLFGGYMLSLLPVVYGAAVLFFLKKQNILFAAFTILSILATVVMIMSGCRGAFAAYLFMLLAPAIVIAKRIRITLKPLIYKLYALICVLGISWVLCSGAIRARILSIFAMRADSSTSFRFNVYHSAIQMFKDNPFLGIGVGNQNFQETYGLYMKTGYDALSAYNIYLETAVESGIFALAAFLGFLYFMISGAVKTIINSNNLGKVIILTTVLSSIIGILCHGFVDTIFFRPQLQFVFWFMAAVIRTFGKFRLRA